MRKISFLVFFLFCLVLANAKASPESFWVVGQVATSPEEARYDTRSYLIFNLSVTDCPSDRNYNGSEVLVVMEKALGNVSLLNSYSFTVTINNASKSRIPQDAWIVESMQPLDSQPGSSWVDWLRERSPLSLSDIGLWFAVMAIILLTTSELLSSSTEYSANIVIDRKNLRLIALALGIGFMITVIVRIIHPL